MLVLQILVEEDIFIQTSDGLITLHLVEAKNHKAKIGLTAPLSIKIDRDKVFNSKYGDLKK